MIVSLPTFFHHKGLLDSLASIYYGIYLSRGIKDKVFAVREWRKIAQYYKQKEWNKKYRQTHREQRRKSCNRWFSLKGKEWRRGWNKNHPDSNRKHCAKRRKLGFIPLNKSFSGSIAHHIDKIHVVYIPERLHTSIPHCVWTGQNMEEINGKVFKWLNEYRKTAIKT
jgi:hypothetical protein